MCKSTGTNVGTVRRLKTQTETFRVKKSMGRQGNEDRRAKDSCPELIFLKAWLKLPAFIASCMEKGQKLGISVLWC